MKIARTFTIDYNLAVELQKKPNQSRIVERSIRRYLSADEDYSISEISSKRLLAVLSQRRDISPILLNAIQFELLHGFK